MRKFMMTVACAAMLAACQPPQQRDAEVPTPDGPSVAACNAVEPNRSRQVGVEEEIVVAAAASDLRGGRITPGTYDLTAARRVGQATGWQGTRAIALEVAENPSGGTIFNWAGADPAGATDTWTASFTDTPQARLTYTCGRVGEVDAGFAADANTLQLRLPDGANGALLMDFARRGG
jgi:hypothetical protein